VGAGPAGRVGLTDLREDRPARGLRDLGWRDWRAVLVRAALDMGDDAAPLLSAGVAFYLFLSVFPGLLVVLSVYGLVADPVQGEAQVTSILAALPGDARELLAARLHTHAGASSHGVTLRLAGAVLGALWTASLGVTGLLKAVKIAYDEEEHRSFLLLRWTGLLLTLATLLVLLLALGLLAVLPVVLDRLGLEGTTRTVVGVLRWAAVVLLALTSLSAVYHLGAGREGSHPGWTAPGTLVAATHWTAINAGYAWYAGGVTDYGSTYGGTAGTVVLLLWLFLTSLVVLFGAEVNAEAERQARGEVRPRSRDLPWVRARAAWRRVRD
jgi:membrane protein